jgi:hypothetical protein
VGRSRDDDKGAKPVRLGDVLSGVVARLGLERDLDDYRLLQAWDEIVGPQVARNAQPMKLDARRLVVAVKNATWLQELTLLRRDICLRLNEWMGRDVVRELFLVIGRLDEEPKAKPRPTTGAGGGRARTEPGSGGEAPSRPADLAEAIERLWAAARARNLVGEDDADDD